MLELSEKPDTDHLQNNHLWSTKAPISLMTREEDTTIDFNYDHIEFYMLKIGIFQLERKTFELGLFKKWLLETTQNKINPIEQMIHDILAKKGNPS